MVELKGRYGGHWFWTMLVGDLRVTSEACGLKMWQCRWTLSTWLLLSSQLFAPQGQERAQGESKAQGVLHQGPEEDPLLKE